MAKYNVYYFKASEYTIRGWKGPLLKTFNSKEEAENSPEFINSFTLNGAGPASIEKIRYKVM